MHPKIMLRPVGWVLSAVGIASVAISVMLSVPLKRPPLLNSIHDGAVAVSELARPPVTEFQARDGTTLAYRLYPARNGSTDRVAIVIHGSAGSSGDMHAVAQALADAGVTAVAVDIRGHGGSGTRGDIAYIGQLDDDLDDLVALLRKSYPETRLSVVAHSSGGGFGLRIASEAEGKVFDRFVLLAPELGYSAPTSRPLEGTAHWANADVPRIIALGLMRRAGIDWAQSLPVVAFATAPTAKQVTWRYSYRLLANFGPPSDWKAALSRVAAPVDIIAGEKDELMFADEYSETIRPYAGKVSSKVLPAVDHMGVIREPAALAAIVADVKQ